MQKTVTDLTHYLEEKLECHLNPEFIFLYYDHPSYRCLLIDKGVIQGIFQNQSQYYFFIVHFLIYNGQQFDFFIKPLSNHENEIAQIKQLVKHWNGDYIGPSDFIEGQYNHAQVYYTENNNPILNNFIGFETWPNGFDQVHQLMTTMRDADLSLFMDLEFLDNPFYKKTRERYLEKQLKKFLPFKLLDHKLRQ